MKHLLALCSVVCLLSCGESPFPPEQLNISSLDHLTLRHTKNGIESNAIAIHLNNDEKKAVLQWIESSRHLNKKDIVSYVPGYVLDSDGVNINFLNKVIVTSYKNAKNPKAGWSQYSRECTEEDKKILNFLKEKSETSTPFVQ